MEITYTQHGDYLLPDLLLPREETASYGKYGQLRKQFLKEHRRATYTTLLTTGQLIRHLNKTEAEARRMVQRLTAQMAQAQGITERLKAADQMAWVGAMNNIRNAAEETVMAEHIYQ